MVLKEIPISGIALLIILSDAILLSAAIIINSEPLGFLSATLSGVFIGYLFGIYHINKIKEINI